MLTHDVLHTILCLCEEANTPRAVGVAICLRYGEYGQLVSLTTDPAHYWSSSEYFRDCLVTDILRKCQGLPTGVDLKARALESFFESERSCFRSNKRLYPYLWSSDLCVEGVSEVISLARKYIRHAIGECPTPDVLLGRFGPGATFADRGTLTTVPDKMSSSPTLCASALAFFPTWASTAWAKAVSKHRGHVDVVRGNRFTTVPKDSSKDRGIAVEPSINVFYQLAYGKAIRRKLKSRCNIDLNDGQEIHRAKAREASARGHLSTIDLSSASDTVCSTLVELLLPRSWFEALSALRSTHTQLPSGAWVRLEKFSSMGNGFTFELETLVFLALCHSIMTLTGHLPLEGVNLLVYGDDIIIPTECYKEVVSGLRFFGFGINGRKSFSTGSFRESCGGDFFDGRPVRAFFLKELPSEPHQWIAFANGLRRVVRDHHLVDGDFRLDLSAWRAALRSLPSSIRSLRGPECLGDLVVHDHETKWEPHSLNNGRSIGAFDGRRGDGIRYFRGWVPVNATVGWQHFRPDVTLASALYGVGDGLRGVTPRGAVTGYVHRWIASS